jgi:hypothetical protein
LKPSESARFFGVNRAVVFEAAGIWPGRCAGVGARRYRVIEIPGRDLGLVPGSTCPNQAGETPGQREPGRASSQAAARW